MLLLTVRLDRMTHELLGQLSLRKETFRDNHMSVKQMGELIDMVQSGKITGNNFVTNYDILV